MIEPWVYSNGGQWVDNIEKPTRYTFNTPEFAEAFQYRADLVLKHKVMPAPSNMTQLGGLGTSDLFMNGNAAMFLSGDWKIPTFREIKGFDWDVVMVPKGPQGKRGFVGGGSGYGILKTSKNKKAAWEFVKYISGPEGEAKMAAAGLMQPALMSVAASPAFLDGQKPMNRKMLLKAVDYSVYQPMSPQWVEVYRGLVFPVEDEVWMGKLTAQEALDKLEKDLKNKPLSGAKPSN
jgi:ABC-type glycerol-3-phosphate transport system substrate-binding protein